MNKTSKKDFIRPEDARPKTGPVYAINTLASKIVFKASDANPALVIDPVGTSGSIRQVNLAMLDTVEFMRLWAPGALLVSTSSKVAEEFTSMELQRTIEEEEKAQKIKDSIERRDESKDYEVVDTDSGRTKVVQKSKTKNDEPATEADKKKPEAKTGQDKK